MPRAPFNTTVEFFAGPNQPNAGESRGTANARLVLKDGITLVGVNAPDVHGWITCDTLTPVGSWTPGLMGFRPSLGDTVAIPVGSEPRYWVCWVEEILWGEQVLYHRAVVAPLPRPAECDCSNADLGDDVEIKVQVDDPTAAASTDEVEINVQVEGTDVVVIGGGGEDAVEINVQVEGTDVVVIGGGGEDDVVEIATEAHGLDLFIDG